MGVKRVAVHTPWHPSRSSCRTGLGLICERSGGWQELETRRTPWPASGCNKPEDLTAEQAVEVVRDHRDGTSSGGWLRLTEGPRQRGPGVDAVRSAGGGATRRSAKEEGRQRSSATGESLSESEGHAGCGPGARVAVLASTQELWRGGRRESPEGQSGNGPRPRGQ